MELYQSLLSRRSVRKYSGEPVPGEALHRILEAGLLAPSGRNLKSTEFITVSDPAMLADLSKMRAAGSGMLASAACAVIVIGDGERSDTWVEDGSIAMTCMMLRAADLGIGSCWVQCRNRTTTADGPSTGQYVKDLLSIPERYQVLAVLALGMPQEPPAPHTPSDGDFSRVHLDHY